jgi:hypothetical protein
MLKKNLNILYKVLLVLICWFFALELFSRAVIKIPLFYHHYIKNVSDAGFRLQWIKWHDYKHDKNDPSVLWTWNVYSPTRGWAVKPNITNKTVFDHKKILNTNSKGIRGKVEYNYEKNPHKTRILILGDSYTFGEGVSDTETYPYYLQQMLPNTEIINFGVNAYGYDQMFIYLQEEGFKYHPDIVLLGHAPWDNIRNLHAFSWAAKPRFCWRKNQLVLCNSPVASPQSILKHEFWRSKLIDLIDILEFDFLSRMGMIHQESERITDHILDEMVRIVRKNNAKIIFVPLSIALINTPLHGAANHNFKEFFNKWENKGVLIVHIKPFPLSDMNKVLFEYKHYKPFVYERIAQGIKEYLLNNNLVKQ